MPVGLVVNVMGLNKLKLPLQKFAREAREESHSFSTHKNDSNQHTCPVADPVCILSILYIHLGNGTSNCSSEQRGYSYMVEAILQKEEAV